ncbi:zinc finger SWIM domain-containing protein 8 homolog isoform X3 [Phlebotomus papatasi]|uniref:zinc finger SWIM domain-containing protein 8 homolog isoform X3 n=1 Tax=Phlebotomus papatasi TaxID=29031 RepID=UPI002484334C|nr:zinc finger SWIM domain-containing protein 8 homolog isoform X3 [Phlebotomus papatasi]
MVFSDVNYLTSCAPPAASEWSSLLRPLRGREPEGMWNLLSIVREMYRRCDRNAIRLLEIITEECMACDQILVWWFNTKLSLLAGTGGHSGGKHSNTHSNSNASQHACSSLCDEIVVLWRLAALNPGLAPDERDMLHAQFTAWHLKILDRVAKNRVGNSSHSTKQQQNSRPKFYRTDAEVFIGFKPAIEACYLDWEDYPIAGITHTQDTNPMYHCPFTCFKHSDSNSHVNSSQAVLMNNVKHYQPMTAIHNATLKNRRERSYRDRCYVSSSNNSNSSSDSVNERLNSHHLDELGHHHVRDDGNRSSASSEGFCENENDDEGMDSGGNAEGGGGGGGGVGGGVGAIGVDEVGGGSGQRQEEETTTTNRIVSIDTQVAASRECDSAGNSCTSSNDSLSNTEKCGQRGMVGEEEEEEEDAGVCAKVTLMVTSSDDEHLQTVDSSTSCSVHLDSSHVNSFNDHGDVKQETSTQTASESANDSYKDAPQPSTSKECQSEEATADAAASTVTQVEAVETSLRRPSKEESLSSSESIDEYNYYYDSKASASGTVPIASGCHSACDPPTYESKYKPPEPKSQIFSNLKPTEDAWDILFARAEGLHAHGHGREACILAVRLAEELLANPPNLMIELPPPPKRKGGKKPTIHPLSHQMSVLASGTLSKCAFLCTVLAENSEHYHLAFRICLFGLEMPRPPASTKPLEVKLANQEADLLALLKRIPLGQLELRVIRERAEHLRDCTLKSRGEALLPIMLASFIFDALVMPSVSGKENRNKVMSMSYRLPTDENLGFEAAVAALGLKANVSEAEHPLLCEGTRRQRGDLALTLLYYYKDEPRKIAKIMEKLLDREIHVLMKTPLLPAYYSNNPPIRTVGQQSRRDEQETVAQMMTDPLQEYGGNSRPQSSTSAELEGCMGAMSLSGAPQGAAGGSGAMGAPGVGPAGAIQAQSTRMKDSRYKGKRPYPSIPNQPSEASAHFMFELAKNILIKAGGTSSTSLFTQASTNQNHHGPHRALHMCAFQLGLYALGLHNFVSPNWLSRTYSSHVCWIIGQAMEIGAPAISFLIDTWEGHLTPPEAAGMADRASRGWDNNMIYPAAELALSVLPHAAALNPNEIQRAILQCKEQSDQMLERACVTVENAAKSGGVYPEVLFQVARYWYELYIRNTPGGEMEHEVGNDIHLDHNVVNLGPLMESQEIPPPPQPAPPPPPQQPPPQPPPPGQGVVVATTTPPQPYQQAVTTLAPIGISHYGPYSFPCQGIYSHHHNIPFPHNQMQMYISTPPQFPYPPPHGPNQQPGPYVQPPPFQQMGHPAAVGPQGYTPMQCPNQQQYSGVQVPVQMPVPPPNNGQMQQNMQYFSQPVALAPPPPPPNMSNMNTMGRNQHQPHASHHSVMYPFVPNPPVRQRHPHQFSQIQLRYLLAAYNVGMLAMETLARRVHDDRPQAKYARDPPYGEDVKWLLRISKKLGTQYLHQFCVCAVNSIVSPFVLHDVAMESAHYLARNNPALVLQHLRSALTPLVQKCQQMYIQCIHQKLYHLTTADYEEFSSIILAARAAFQITPEGNAQFKDWLQSIRRSKSCKKDLWTQINAALQNNSK